MTVRVDALSSSQRKSPRRRRIALVSAAAIVLSILGLYGHDYVQRWRGESLLAAAIAEADRLDPGWRLWELEAKRVAVPADKDSAVLVKNVGTTGRAILNKGKVREGLWEISKQLGNLPPAASLTGEQTEALRARLAPLAVPIAEARKIANLPQGRHPFNCSPGLRDGASHVDDARIATWLLHEDVILRAQDGDLDNAWESCRGAFNLARSWAKPGKANSPTRRRKSPSSTLPAGSAPSAARRSGSCIR